MSIPDGEKRDVREHIDRYTKHLVEHGNAPDKAREIARRAAVQHHHNEGRRDPNRHRRD
jgi:hypothetical protein